MGLALRPRELRLHVWQPTRGPLGDTSANKDRIMQGRKDSLSGRVAEVYSCSILRSIVCCSVRWSRSAPLGSGRSTRVWFNPCNVICRDVSLPWKTARSSHWGGSSVRRTQRWACFAHHRPVWRVVIDDEQQLPLDYRQKSICNLTLAIMSQLSKQ